MKDFKKVFLYFLPTLKKYKLMALFVTGLYISGNIVANVITPLFYKKIIDEAGNQFLTAGYDFNRLLQMMVSIIIAGIIYAILNRTGSHYINNLENDS